MGQKTARASRRLKTEIDGESMHGVPRFGAESATVREIRTRIRERGKVETTALPAICRQETAALAQELASAAVMPIIHSLSSSVYRIRRALPPLLPQTRPANAIPQHGVKAGNQRFLLASEVSNEFMIFLTDENLRLM